MGEVIDMLPGRRRFRPTKGSPEREESSRDRKLAGQRLLQRLEERKEIYGPQYVRWRLKKRDRGDRIFLLQLARNLSEILDWLPHGKRGEVLEKAKSDGSAKTGDANKYVTRVAIKERAGDPVVLVKPLTPAVGKYIAVARAAGEILERLPGGRKDTNDCLKRLFRGTPLDEPDDEDDREVPIWADHLAEMLSGICMLVARRYRVDQLFDRMTDANIYATDNSRTPQFMVSAWLSETFDKLALSSYSAVDEDYLIHERTEEGIPWSGLPLFVPRTLLLREMHTIALGTLQSGSVMGAEGWVSPDVPIIAQAQLVMTLETWLAIVPEADGYDEPCDTRGCFMLRPALCLDMEGVNGNVEWWGATKDRMKFVVSTADGGKQVVESRGVGTSAVEHLPKRFVRWFTRTNWGGVWFEEDERFEFKVDLDSEPWWAALVSGESVSRILEQPNTEESRFVHEGISCLETHFAVPEKISWMYGLGDFMSPSDGLPNRLEPRLPPEKTVARDLCQHLLDQGPNGSLTTSLEEDARRIRVTFEELEEKVGRAFDKASSRFFSELRELEDYSHQQGDE